MTYRTALFGVATSAALVMGVFTTSASAGGDLAPTPPPFSWTGLYVGVQGGHGRGDTEHFFTQTALFAGEWDVSGSFFGATWGYNWQRGNIVYGLESDISKSYIDGDFAGAGCNTGNCFTDIRWFGTTRARVGVSWNSALLYATGGLAYGSVHAGVFNSPDEDTRTRWGWALGAGIEWAFAPSWSVKAEYLHLDFGDRHNYTVVGTGNRVDVDVDADIVRVGVNYRFGARRW